MHVATQAPHPMHVAALNALGGFDHIFGRHLLDDITGLVIHNRDHQQVGLVVDTETQAGLRADQCGVELVDGPVGTLEAHRRPGVLCGRLRPFRNLARHQPRWCFGPIPERVSDRTDLDRFTHHIHSFGTTTCRGRSQSVAINAKRGQAPSAT